MARSATLLLGSIVLTGLAGAFYFFSGVPAPADLLALIRGERSIAPGFIGTTNFGLWRLICVPGPSTLAGLSAGLPVTAATKDAQHRINACRVNLEMPAASPNTGDTPGQIIVATNFSLVGDKRMPAVMLRVPPTAKVGDVIGLRVDNQAPLQTSVRNCSDSECLAAGTMSEAEWAHLIAAQNLEVSFPASNRQRVLLNLPGEGLSAAIAAMSRAQIASSSS